MKRGILWLLCLAMLFSLAACGSGTAAEETDSPTAQTPGQTEEEEEVPDTVTVAGQVVVVDDSLEPNSFSEEDFVTNGTTGRITCVSREALTGVDVSKFQGEIDWQAVAADGIDFAILRLGNRGYSKGTIVLDERFEENYTGATEAGLLVGTYFFSQAISVEEAVEEADYVLSVLDGRDLDLPVVFDWEEISGDSARTDDVSGRTVTECALAFCARVEEAGYRSAFYFNNSTGYLIYDMSQLQGIDAWVAEYRSWPSFAYAFDLWQYSKDGVVDGISSSVDLDLYFPKLLEDDLSRDSLHNNLG